MPLRASYNTAEEIPEDARPLYRASEITLPNGGGKRTIHILDVDASDGFALENVTGLKTALSNERTGHQKLKDQLAKYRTDDGEPYDPEAVQTAMDFYSKRDDLTKQSDDKIKQKVTDATAELVKKHKKTLDEFEVKNKTLFGALAGEKIVAAAMKELLDKKGAPELLLPIIEKRARLREDNGQYMVEILDGTGNVAVNSSGSAMTIGDLVDELRNNDRYSRAFDGSGNSGGGTPTTKPGVNRADSKGVIQIKSSDQASINANAKGIGEGTHIVVDG